LAEVYVFPVRCHFCVHGTSHDSQKR